MKKLLYILILLSALTACADGRRKYRIGISQCSDDIWREKQNSELLVGAYCHPDDVELCFAAAYDSDERQVQQIDSLLAIGIDLLIVAPNQVATITPAIDRAYDGGIPVIVFERKTNSQKYTAYIGADNYEMGRVMGEYVASRLDGKGRVVEVMGLKGSSPAIERHKGFAEALSRHPGIQLVATLQGDWTEESAYQAVSTYGGDLQDVDYVFGQNDRMAIGARRAMADRHQLAARTLFCGIDGLPGPDGGIQLVRDSILDATYIYPTHGDQLIQLATDILNGRPYNKETALMSALVTRDNASVLMMQADEMIRQSAYLDRLHQTASQYLQKLDTQRVITWMAFGVIVLLILTIVLFYLYHIGKVTLHRARVVNSLWNLKTEDVPVAEPEAAESDEEEERKKPSTVPSVFITRFREVVEARLSESELGVEDLANDMHLSRVQLYRKVKAVTDSTPIELLRAARLNRAYQLLLTTDLSVSEIAYKVGFTSPSYFTKCFKDEYGKVPGDCR
ncbi:MAG: substrate-binding domain-containing protein [Prevotella sp.]|nr:substrate-binding domain-containing protein [Prevotella sp.]